MNINSREYYNKCKLVALPPFKFSLVLIHERISGLSYFLVLKCKISFRIHFVQFSFCKSKNRVGLNGNWLLEKVFPKKSREY